MWAHGVSGLSVVALLSLVAPGTADHHFTGGTCSTYVTRDNKTGNQLVQLDLLTGWFLGKGPCGPTCSRVDVGKSTLPTRRLLGQNFGYWLVEAKRGHRYYDRNITDIIERDMTETVVRIAQQDGWEQEYTRVTFNIENNVTDEDVIYEGMSWPLLSSIPNRNVKWHMQVKFNTGVRNDTGKPNHSPLAYSRPIYRITSDHVTSINIPVVDRDEDFVKCESAQYIEAGGLSTYHNQEAEGITVGENCQVRINASRLLNYTNGFRQAVAVSIRDFNRQPMFIDNNGDNDGVLLPAVFSVSVTPLQFLVEVVDHVTGPRFVAPTLPGNQEIWIYLGSMWTTNIAAASENSTMFSIESFGRNQELIRMYASQRGPSRLTYLFGWKPSRSDLGPHIFCFTAIDTVGEWSNEDRCFRVHVKDKLTTRSTATRPTTSKPRFIDTMPIDPLPCAEHTVCTVPVYIESLVCMDLEYGLDQQ